MLNIRNNAETPQSRLHGKKMVGSTVIFLLIFLICKLGFAQEKVVGDVVIDLGVISWNDIKEGFKEDPKTPIEKSYLKTINKMAQAHAEEVRGSYHILVILKDKTSGQHIKDAEVEVVAKRGLKKVKHKLQPMIIEDYSGYGQFFKLSPNAFYIFEVKFYLPGTKKSYQVTFKRSLE